MGSWDQTSVWVFIVVLGVFLVSSLLGILGCLLFPACWQYWGLLLLEEDDEEEEVVSAQVKLSSPWAGWGEGMVCGTNFSEPRIWGNGRVTLLQQHVCQAFVLPKGAAAGPDWELLQYCFLGTAVQLAAGLQRVWNCTSFPGDFAACLWTWLTYVALCSRLLEPKITEGVKCCSTTMVGAHTGTLPRSQMLSKPD